MSSNVVSLLADQLTGAAKSTERYVRSKSTRTSSRRRTTH
jgi:hypothetical protein